MPTANGTDFQFLTENSADIICRAGLDRVLHYVSPSSLSVLGWTSEEMTGKLVDEFILAEDFPILAATIARNISDGASTGSVILRMLKKNGSTTWMENTARILRDSATGQPKEFVVTMRDINERKMLEEKLIAQTLTDSLTGLANRRAFDKALVREWKHTLRDGSQISLLLLDIDHFKSFNDRYGHQIGDDCLRAVALAVAGAIRATDFAARYGGEELAVILPSTEIAGAVAVAEKIRSAVCALRFPHEGSVEGAGWLTASIGAATALARQGGTIHMPESLLQAADSALYRAKHDGRNRVATALLIAPFKGDATPLS